jgi:benzoylformate decarboxylase
MAITPLDAARFRRGASLLMEILRSEGVEYIFGNPGTTELPLMDALLEVADIRYILALQEASAVAMADGYAPASSICTPPAAWGMGWAICSTPASRRRRWW